MKRPYAYFVLGYTDQCHARFIGAFDRLEDTVELAKAEVGLKDPETGRRWEGLQVCQLMWDWDEQDEQEVDDGHDN